MKLYQDPEWLYQKYWEEGYTMPEVAELASCGRRTIVRWMDKYDIARRSSVPRIRPLADRFWEKVDIGSLEECWEWMACCSQDGYGMIKVDGEVMRAPRVAWTLTYDEIPEGLCVCHHCDNPSCCNPDHLYVGTHADNMQDMSRRGRGVYPGTRGEDHGPSKLTELEVHEIRRLRNEEGWALRELGMRFSISESNVSAIALYKSWRWLE